MRDTSSRSLYSLTYSFEQFLHADHVPGIPLPAVTPTWIFGHSIWTYLTAVVYAVAGPLRLAGRKTRAAATWLGMIVPVTILVVYVPIGIAERASLNNGLNCSGDTLMFCGDVLSARERHAAPPSSPVVHVFPDNEGRTTKEESTGTGSCAACRSPDAKGVTIAKTCVGTSANAAHKVCAPRLESHSHRELDIPG